MKIYTIFTGIVLLFAFHFINAQPSVVWQDNLYGESKCIAMDDQNNVYYMIGDGSFDSYFTVYKYDSDGNELWNTGSLNGRGVKVGVSSTYDVYAVYTKNSTSSPRDISVVKYDSDGNQVWDVQYPSVYTNYANDGFITPNGNVYITGYIINSADNRLMVTARFNSSGSLVWDETIDPDPADSQNEGHVVIVKGIYTYVYGAVNQNQYGNAGQVCVVKYNNLNGAKQFTCIPADTLGSSDDDANSYAQFIGVSDGVIYNIDYNADDYCYKITNSGELEWVKYNSFTTVGKGGSGYFMGTRNDSVLYFSNDGTEIWGTDLPTTNSVHQLVTDSYDRVYINTSSNVLCYDENGELLWNKEKITGETEPYRRFCFMLEDEKYYHYISSGENCKMCIPPEASAWRSPTDPSLEVCSGESVQLFSSYEYGDSLVWSPNIDLSPNQYADNPIASYSDDPENHHLVEYTVTVYDTATGCSMSVSVDDYYVRALPNGGLTEIEPTYWEVCEGENEILTVGNPPGTETYEWFRDGASIGNNSNTLATSIAGDYSCVIENSYTCIDTSVNTYSFEPVENPSVFLGNDTTLCEGEILILNAGSGYHSYSWNTGETSQTITVDTAGTYFVEVENDALCTGSDTIVIDVASALVDLGENDTICFGDVALLDAGSGFDDYLWNTTEETQSISIEESGEYWVQVTNSLGCDGFDTIYIYEADEIVSSLNPTDVSCNGLGDGSINLEITSGESPFTFNWSNSETSQNIENLFAGTYSVLIYDRYNCEHNDTNIVSEPDVLEVAISKSNVQCYGFDNGSATANISGGTSPFAKLWSNGDTTVSIENLTPGEYYIDITDANGCTASDTIEIIEPAEIVLNITGDDATCFGGSDGSATASASKGLMSYEWSNGKSGTSVSGLSAGWYYCTVTNSDDCFDIDSIEIKQPEEITIDEIVTNSSGSDGAIDITVSGGNSGYSFNWSNGEETEDISGLAPGTYTITVTDSEGCSQSKSIVVNDISCTLEISISDSANLTCYQSNNGFIEISATNGSVPYSFEWNTGDTTQIIEELITGTYTVTVTDNNGCYEILSCSISQPDEIVTSITEENVTCYGLNDGEIDLFAMGGTSPLEFEWSNGSTNEDLFSLNPGIYTVRINDANGCLAYDTAAIAEPDILEISYAVINSNGADGEIDLTISGGTFPYYFNWSNGETSEDLTNLSPGTYAVTVTDKNGCSAFKSIIVNDISCVMEAIIVDSSNISCFDVNDGFIEIYATNGEEPYSYSWSSGQSDSLITGLDIGTYTVTVIDNAGCQSTISCTLSQPEILSSNTTVNPVSCNGGSDGSIDLSVSGGTIPYNFNWSNGNENEDLENIAAGAYIVEIIDGNGCLLTDTGIIVQPEAIEINYNVTHSTGNNGEINITVIGGTGFYSFNWSNGEITEDISGLSPGYYTITVADENSCEATETIQVIDIACYMELSVINISNLSCYQANDGLIEVAVTNASEPINFMWDNGDTTALIQNLTVGDYTLIAIDSMGCSDTISINITQPGVLESSILIEDISCNGFTDGSADLTVIGGTAGYSFNWSNGFNGEDLSNVVAGEYIVEIEDANGCILSDTAFIYEPDSITIEYEVVNANGGSNGAIDISVTGGSQPYSYIWSNGSISEDLQDIPAGEYTITITDANDCVAESTILVIDEFCYLAVEVIDSNDVSCYGLGDGSATAETLQSVGDVTYLWSDGQSNANAMNLVAGEYFVIATDSIGCVDTAYVTINQPDSLYTQFQITDVSESGGSDGAINITVFGGTPSYSFEWSNGSTYEDIDNLEAGMYTVFIMDQNNCERIDSAIVNQPDIILNPISKADCKVYPNPSSTGRFQIEFNNKTTSNYETKILTLKGRILFDRIYQHRNSFSVDASFLPNGIYQLVIFSNDKPIYYGKIVIIK